MADWRDWSAGRTGVSVANLDDGESCVAQIVAEPFRRETEHSDDALHVPVVFLEVPDGFEDMSGDQVETGEDEDGEPIEYNVINSSSSFFNALTGAFPDADSIDGQTMEIEAYQAGEDQFSRFYNISAV